jgi:DNA mismatch endonuclease (patch repair protein)
MKKILARFNKTTEEELKRIFIKHSIKGWRRHLPIPGRPDFSFRKQKVAVFVDGCFWHGCPRCFRLPKQNRAFWKKKIEGNRRRDRSVNGRLRRLGWKSLRIRECNLKHPNKVLDKIKAVI